MQKHEDLEKITEKKYSQKDKSKSPKMHVSGKSIFKLQEIIRKKHDSSSTRKDNKKNR